MLESVRLGVGVLAGNKRGEVSVEKPGEGKREGGEEKAAEGLLSHLHCVQTNGTAIYLCRKRRQVVNLLILFVPAPYVGASAIKIHSITITAGRGTLTSGCSCLLAILHVERVRGHRTVYRDCNDTISSLRHRINQPLNAPK